MCTHFHKALMLVMLRADLAFAQIPSWVHAKDLPICGSMKHMHQGCLPWLSYLCIVFTTFVAQWMHMDPLRLQLNSKELRTTMLTTHLLRPSCIAKKYQDGIAIQ